jgi:hypothetical protein
MLNMLSATAIAAGLSVGVISAGVAQAPTAHADRSDDRQYVANLLDLGVGVTPDNVPGYLQDAVAVCRGMDSGYSAVDNMNYLMNGNRTRNDASAIVVSAIDVYCPRYNGKLG